GPVRHRRDAAVLRRHGRLVGPHGAGRTGVGRHLALHRRAHLVVLHVAAHPVHHPEPAPAGHVGASLAGRTMIAAALAAALFLIFIALMIVGVPVGVALGAGGAFAILMSNLDTHWFGLMAVPQSFYAGVAKYPLLAVPMLVLVGSIFDRSGVASRLVNFAIAVVGRGPGMLPLVAIAVAMFLGGISGSGPACAAAVGAVMIGAMKRAGYPNPFSASIVAAGAATDILIPPSIAFIIYSVLVPEASVPALFAAGMVPGMLAGIALIIPAVWLARRHKMGGLESALPRPPFWRSL